MLAHNNLLGTPFEEKTIFSAEFEETKFVELMQQKEREINTLKKTIKKLERQIQFKNQLIRIPENLEGQNLYFKTLIEREISRYDQLKNLVSSVTLRVKKLTLNLDQEISISQNSSTVQNIFMMLNGVDISRESQFWDIESKHGVVETWEVENILDQLEISLRKMLQKYGETNKNYKQLIQTQKQHLQQITYYKEAMRKQKRSKDLLQKLLEKNEMEKNELVNQINFCINQHELENLKSKTKQQIILYAYKLNYRIKDLQQEKQQYIKERGRQMEKEMQLYQKLVNQVKTFKYQAKIKKSIA